MPAQWHQSLRMEPAVSTIDIRHAHSMPHAKARKAVEDVARKLAERFDMSRPSVSEHLKVLKDAGLVAETRRGRERLYRLEPTELQEISEWILPYRRFWQVSLGNLKNYLENE